MIPGRAWLVVAVMLAALCACTRTTPEQRLRDTVASLQAAIQARDTGDIREVLADDFVGPEGLDREGAVRMAQAMFLRHREIGVTMAGPLQVRMQPGHASVRFEAALTGGSGSVLPDAARLYSVETGWRLDDGNWRLTSADWKPRL
jgi:ketosteroid isomerase-like protein